MPSGSLRSQNQESTHFEKDNCKSQSEYIEKAIWFSPGYLDTKHTDSYLPRVLSDVLGHVSAATTLDIYTYIAGNMQAEAAAKIDRGLDNEVREDTSEATQNPPTDFQPVIRHTRKSGSRCITEFNDHLFEGRYASTWPDGTKHSTCVYAHTWEECERS